MLFTVFDHIDIKLMPLKLLALESQWHQIAFIKNSKMSTVNVSRYVFSGGNIPKNSATERTANTTQ